MHSGIYKVSSQGADCFLSGEHFTDQVGIRDTQKRYKEFIFIRPVASEIHHIAKSQSLSDPAIRKAPQERGGLSRGVNHCTV